MKIAISGKGGVGKTTLSAALAATLSLQGRGVIALDADPDANLAAALGLPEDEQPTPLAEMEELIAERTGAKDAAGGYFKLNPKVDDIPERFAKRIGNMHLLLLGGVPKGGSGCICPASALVKALLTHLVLGRSEAVIMDMEAGIEHLGRATAQSMDALVVVVDEGPWSSQTALRIRALAGDLGMKRIFAVANRIGDPASIDAIARELDGIPLIGWLPYDRRLATALIGRTDQGNIEASEGLDVHRSALEGILSKLQGAL